MHFSSANSEWTTPPELFEKLYDIYSFTIDACASDKNTLLSHYYTKADSCLDKTPVGERIFMNPPYGREIGKFVQWAYEVGSRNLVIALLPARTDTKWFHSYIYNKAKITFLPGRLKFGGAKNSAPFPSMIVDFTRCV